MSICTDISDNLQKGKAKVVKELVQKALDEGTAADTILKDGLLAGMDVIGNKFKDNEIFVPEVLIAARAMNGGMEILKPKLVEKGVKPIGKAAIGTCKGDLHDIGKNLVGLMFQGKGIEVIDLGVDVDEVKFYETFQKEGVQIIGMSAMMTTTMEEMKVVVDYFKEKGVRDKVKVLIGGASVSHAYAKATGADGYAEDASSAAELAISLLK